MIIYLHGKKIKDDSKENLLDIVSNKSVSFTLGNKISIPDQLKEYNAVVSGNKLALDYDKNKTNLKNIINILNKNKINFVEINTYESDLEDVFLKLIRSEEN